MEKLLDVDPMGVGHFSFWKCYRLDVCPLIGVTSDVSPSCFLRYPDVFPCSILYMRIEH